MRKQTKKFKLIDDDIEDFDKWKAQYEKKHSFNISLAMSVGIEKAILMENHEEIKSEYYKDIHEFFPYMDVDVLYKNVNELIDMGYIPYKKKIK